MGGISNTKVSEAGELLRDWRTAGAPDDLKQEPLASAVTTLFEYRVSFAGPLATVEAELRPLVGEVSPGAELAGRPKRAAMIIAKLVRFPSMRLTQMNDIAGLRVKFPNGPREAQSLLRRMEDRWSGFAITDYVADPKRTGDTRIRLGRRSSR